MNEKLLPCPLCNTKVKKGGNYKIECQHCGLALRWYKGEEVIINQWNTRYNHA